MTDVREELSRVSCPKCKNVIQDKPIFLVEPASASRKVAGVAGRAVVTNRKVCVKWEPGQCHFVCGACGHTWNVPSWVMPSEEHEMGKWFVHDAPQLIPAPTLGKDVQLTVQEVPSPTPVLNDMAARSGRLPSGESNSLTDEEFKQLIENHTIRKSTRAKLQRAHEKRVLHETTVASYCKRDVEVTAALHETLSKMPGAGDFKEHHAKHRPSFMDLSRHSEDELTTFRGEACRIAHGKHITYVHKKRNEILVYKHTLIDGFLGVFPLEPEYWAHGIFRGGYANPNVAGGSGARGLANDPKYKDQVLQFLGVPSAHWHGPLCVKCGKLYREHAAITNHPFEAPVESLQWILTRT